MKADSAFNSVPVNDGDDSHDLRTAHAQRAISTAICQYIWKPLSSECTLLHPEFNSFLSKLPDELHKSSPGGRAARIWTALTMRALQSLLVDSLLPHISESKERSQPARPTRAEHVVSKVFSVLSPRRTRELVPLRTLSVL